jgi:hypothetical protein
MEATRRQIYNITGLLNRRKKRTHNCSRVDTDIDIDIDIDQLLESQAETAALNRL